MLQMLCRASSAKQCFFAYPERKHCLPEGCGGVLRVGFEPDSLARHKHEKGLWLKRPILSHRLHRSRRTWQAPGTQQPVGEHHCGVRDQKNLNRFEAQPIISTCRRARDRPASVDRIARRYVIDRGLFAPRPDTTMVLPRMSGRAAPPPSHSETCEGSTIVSLITATAAARRATRTAAQSLLLIRLLFFFASRWRERL
jgi:hypothetical protein